MPHEFSKRQRKILRELAGKAHEHEIRRHLEKLHASFELWRKGEMDTWDLTYAIHRFHQGPDRRLQGMCSRNSTAHFYVARAIATGLLKEEEAPVEIQEAIASTIDYCKREITEEAISVDEEESRG